MKDKEIYSEIAKLLYCEAPDVSSEIHALAMHVENSSFISVWTGELRSVDGAFNLSREALRKINGSVNELKEYYLEKNMGDWNIAHFIAIPHAKKFELEFDYCEELKNHELSFTEYSRRLNESSRIHKE
ncbi:hypothetical protein ACJJID_05710 [Microbulbifer sp. CnH-101-G]|uniref:hypothetical protein n=1 Tax=Microbulbifer sp. CnH-101-G TaxID=3243393 RepID=UPI004039DD35